MKTNNLQRKSILTNLILLATAAYHGVKGKLYSKENTPVDFQKTNGKYIYGGCRARNLQAIYIPQRKKLKGYQKQQSTFNKRKRAA